MDRPGAAQDLARRDQTEPEAGPLVRGDRLQVLHLQRLSVRRVEHLKACPFEPRQICQKRQRLHNLDCWVQEFWEVATEVPQRGMGRGIPSQVRTGNLTETLEPENGGNAREVLAQRVEETSAVHVRVDVEPLCRAEPTTPLHELQ